MGFFQDLKEDLSQAVTELMDEENMNEEQNGKMETDNDEVETLDKEVVEALEEMNVSQSENETTDGADDLLTEEIPVAEEQEEEIPEILMSETEAVEEMPEEPEEPEVPEELEEASVNQVVMDDESEALMKDMLKEMEAVKEKHTKVENIMPEEYENEEAIDETAIITNGMVIKGDVSSKGSMEVIGSIEGNIDILGKLNITGAVKGNSKAAEVFADAAKIVGEVSANGTVKIGASSVIIGNIQASSAVIAGAVKGDIDVQGPVVLDTSAIVMGNIKSKSVQINNGAVIEGMCSQCYADVNPISFFDEFK